MMKSFLAGFGVGAGLGLVFAPAVGQETRLKLRSAMKAMAAVPSHLLSQRPGGDATGHSAGAAGISSADGRFTQEHDTSPHELKSFQQPEAVHEAHESSGHDSVAEILNTASKTKLKRVKGIGEATAKRIIEHRPYDNVSAALENSVLSEENLSKLKKELLDKDEVA